MESSEERKGLSRRSLLAGLGLGTAGVFLAAACGGTATPVMEDKAEGAEAPKAEEEMKQAEEASPVQFLHWWIQRVDPGGLTPWALEEFTNRTGIPVEEVAKDPIEPLRQHFRTTIAAGTPVDVAFNSIIWARDHWDLGLLMDYEPYLSQYPHIQDDQYFEASNQFRKTEGATFGIPVMGPQSQSIVVNGQLLIDIGLDENGGDINNWDDLTAAARAMTKKDGDNFNVSGFLLPDNVHLARWAGWMLTTGTGAYDAEQYKAFYNTEQARDTMQFLFNLWNREDVSAKSPEGGTLTDPPHHALLQANQAGMHYDHTSAPKNRYFEVPRDFKYWLMGYPSHPDGGQFATASWMNPVVTPVGAGNPDGAVEFINWFCGLEVALRKLEVNKDASPRLDLFAHEAWTAGVADHPVLQTQEDIAKLPGVYPYRRYLKQNAEVKPILNDAYQGKIEIASALAQADERANQILNEPAE
jgi:ABC-type glycerol-3-phosphate transport system substrate-binding protein